MCAVVDELKVGLRTILFVYIACLCFIPFNYEYINASRSALRAARYQVCIQRDIHHIRL